MVFLSARFCAVRWFFCPHWPCVCVFETLVRGVCFDRGSFHLRAGRVDLGLVVKAMESSAAVAGWAGGGGAAVGGDALHCWDGGSSGQSGYGEYAYQAPTAQQGGGYGESGTKDHPPPIGSDPPYKKAKNMSGESVGGAEQRDESGGGYGLDLGHGEGPPGSGYGRLEVGVVHPSNATPTGPPG
eukprot:c27025_g1_i1 orf=147-698(+)